VKIVIPLVPPSVNSYVRHTRKGGHYVTAEAKAFKEAVAILGREKGDLVAEAYHVHIDVYLGKNGRGDLDNFAKIPIDALVYAGIIRSDSDVEAVSLRKFRDPGNPRTEITIEAL
jgi:crossover junction endodeoxyribonuclease RusA